ncbi:MAG: hypothetical protein M1820_008083 [Bogoriella megaspora]|nr:MAG: hypothetical protein M1820_008083 [Bogoriella megaspora]
MEPTHSTHRRIELQSAADLRYLKSNARRAARQIIDLHLPPTAAPEGGEEDVFRRAVESSVEEYIKNIFASALHSVSINGLEPTATERMLLDDDSQEGEDAYEPYDTRLASRLTTLANTHNDLILSLANLRRTAPAQAADAVKATYETHATELESQSQAEAEIWNKEYEGYELNAGKFERWDDVEKMWDRGTQGLVGLKSGLTETVARCERAVEVAAEVDGK